MGQQPNIELEISDLPRPRPKPDPARAWTPGRPGELGGPDDMRWGAGFGTTGPDAGYAMFLAAARELELAPGEHRGDVDAAVAAVATARASLFGRGPTGQDIDLAMTLLGLDAATPESAATALAAKRREWFAAAGHRPDKLTAFLAGVDEAVLRLTAAEVRERLGQGQQLING